MGVGIARVEQIRPAKKPLVKASWSMAKGVVQTKAGWTDTRSMMALCALRLIGQW